MPLKGPIKSCLISASKSEHQITVSQTARHDASNSAAVQQKDSNHCPSLSHFGCCNHKNCNHKDNLLLTPPPPAFHPIISVMHLDLLQSRLFKPSLQGFPGLRVIVNG